MLKVDPNIAEALYCLGAICQQYGKPDGAMDHPVAMPTRNDSNDPVCRYDLDNNLHGLPVTGTITAFAYGLFLGRSGMNFEILDSEKGDERWTKMIF